MDSNIEWNLKPEISMDDDVLYDCIPPELVVRIDRYLSFEDSFRFQISDDSTDCCIMSTKGHVPKRNFLESNLNAVFIRIPELSADKNISACSKIMEVIMIMKDVGSLQRCSCGTWQSLKDTSLYQKNGFLGYLFSKMPQQMIAQLKTVSLHVDIMRDNLRQLCFPCPTQDLFYSIHHLADSHFETFIQISFCSATIQPEDYHLRNILLNGMEMTLKNVAKYCAKTDFTVDAAEGYADMTVEKGRMEYSFAFFYYNPHICGTESQSAVEEMDQSDKQVVVNSAFPNGKLISSKDRNDNGDNDNCSGNSSNNNDNVSYSSSGDGNSSSILMCLNTPNQIHCQSDLQISNGIYASFWRNLMKTH
uniref:F-box domain-containing protein n=1 Tax=Elaeophora elaphi TaxID=1147741 RepID=A0A0R3RS34_9BILA